MSVTSKRSVLGIGPVFLAMCITPLLGSAAWGQLARLQGGDARHLGAAATVMPGKVLLLGAADGVGSGSDISDVRGAEPGTAQLLGTGSPLSDPLKSFVCANRRLSRATGEVFRFDDFVVDAEWNSAGGLIALPEATALSGRVTGTVDVRGFLVMIGVGQATEEVVVELLDITGLDPAAPDVLQRAIVVGSQTLSKHELVGALNPGVDLEMTVEGGAAYVGAGVGATAGNQMNFELLKVADNVDFGLDVMVRRGHVYRLIVKNKTEGILTAAGTGVGQAGGKAIASFHDPVVDPSAGAPNLLKAHMNRLLSISNDQLQIPVNLVAMQNVPLEFSVVMNNLPPGLSADNFDLLSVLSDPRLFRGSSAKSENIIDLLGTNFLPNLAGSRVPLSLIGLTTEFFDVGDQALVEEQSFKQGLNEPGVKVSRLAVSIEQDQAELAERQRIEDGLDTCELIVAHVLPDAFGGKLEKVRFLVREKIDQVFAAGLPIQNAESKFTQGVNAFNAGNYRQAYQRFCEAYNQLLSSNDDDDDHDDDDHDDDDHDDDDHDDLLPSNVPSRHPPTRPRR